MQIKVKRKLFYKVDKEDDLENIFYKLHTDISTIKEINKTNNIEVNDILLLPKYNYKYYVVKPYDTYKTIANYFKVDELFLREINDYKELFLGKKILVEYLS